MPIAVLQPLSGCYPLPYTQKTGVTPLIKACLKRNAECAQILLDHGADANVADKNGWTSLLQACDSGYTECVEVLLIGGADLQKALHASLDGEKS
eukprot:38134-Pelagomonas_calceolata.AAC.8